MQVKFNRNPKGKNMKEVIKLFKQIQETSGKNDKINIVKANADNELFKKCVYNNFYLTNRVFSNII